MSNIMLLTMLTLISFLFMNLKKNKILILLYMELTMMWMITLLVWTNSKYTINNMTNLILILIIMVTESILGVSIMISSSRNSTKFSSNTISWF